MSKNKVLSVDSLSSYSPDFVFTYFKDRTRDKLHLLKAKITQYQEKNYPANLRRNISLDQIAKFNFDALIKHQKHKAWLQNQNPESQDQMVQNQQDISETNQDQSSLELSQEEKIYFEHSVLKYVYKQDFRKKWKVNVNPEIDYSFLKDSQVFQFLSLLYMFQNGYFPFVGKKEIKSKIFVQHMDMLKNRPSQNFQTFKAPLTKDYWVIFSWAVERLESQLYTICVDVSSIRKELNNKKIDHEIDQRLKQERYKISPGQVVFTFDKDIKLKPEQIFKFGDKSFHFGSSSTDLTRRVFPSKVERLKVDLQIVPQKQTVQSFDYEIQILGDNSNYQSVRYIYKQLEDNDYFSYALSPSQYDVLETRGNLIVIGRSGSGKTTCALLRLFFKELNNTQKQQKNIFLTASSVLIAQIKKKYDQLKQGIKKIHNYDYFQQQNQAIFEENYFIRNFYEKLDEINETLMRKKINSFLQCKIFPCFLTIRQYIESIDVMMENPFFSTKSSQNVSVGVQEEIIITYPDQIQWQQRVRKTRRLKNTFGQTQNEGNQQEWLQIKFNYFARKICEQPEIKRMSSKLSPQIIWSQIYSTIKGSVRAHSFVNKFLDFETYCKQSKNEFLTVDDKKNVYQIFLVYEKIKLKTKQYDLLDVVNNIITQLGQRKNQDLALSSLFIDEVQDLPPAFIFLAGKIVQQSLFFCGDTAQTIAKGVSFSFSDIRDQFSQKYFEKGFKLEKPKIKQLGVNFRSQNQIIQLSNCLIRCLEMIFPKFIDKMPFEESPVQGPKPVIMGCRDSLGLARIFRQEFGDRLENNRNNMFGADKAIIVRNKESKTRIPIELAEMTCLTYQQCKGLQYNVVILYNFFTQSSNVQWSFLKHIELQNRANGVKGLAFDKNRLGSNIKMYFDLCSQLKILYTVVTRPRTILIICDDNVPDQLMRIWKHLDLVQDGETFFRQINRSKDSNNDNGINNQRPQNIRNDRNSSRPNIGSPQQIDIPQCLNLDYNHNRNEQNFQKFRKQWAGEGFKLFFDHKLFDQAVKCFRHAQIKELQQISKAYFFAQYAYEGAETIDQSLENYNRAAQFFKKYKRYYEAGKCYYLGQQYEKALEIFSQLNIKKYKAQCLWKMCEYSQAEQLFFNESIFKKCFNILIESEYWFMMFARLYENPVEFRKIGYNQVRKGLDEIMQSFLRTFTTWILQSWDQNNLYWFVEVIRPIMWQRYGDKVQKKISYLKKNYYYFLSEQKLLYYNCPQKKGQIDEVHLNFVNRIYLNEGKKGVIDNFLTTLMYVGDILGSYNLVGNFKKYNAQKQQSFGSEYQIEKITQSNILKVIFNILQTFDCYQFIGVFSKSLKMVKIQQLIIVENILKIDLRKNDKDLTVYRVNLHYELINQVDNGQIKDKLSILLLMFCKFKDLGHFYYDQDILISEYMDIYDLPKQKLITFKLLKVQNEHQFVCFDQNYKKNHNKRTLHLSYQYKKMFQLFDDLSPNSFLQKNQKQKQYVEHFKTLTKQQTFQLQQRQKLAVQQKVHQLEKKIKRLQTDLEYAQQEKIKIYADTSKQEAQALQKKIKFMKLIPDYIWLPEQCQKLPYKAYSMKKTIDQIRIQRNQVLKTINQKTNEKVQQLKQKVNTLKTLKQFQKKFNLQKENLNQQQNKCMKKDQEVQYAAEIVAQIQRYLSPITDEIKLLQSEKTGSKGHDKKLNHRIKNLNDKIKPELIVLNERKKDYNKVKTEYKQLQQEYQIIAQKLQDIYDQIRQNKEFLCQLNLAQLDNEQNLILCYTKSYTITLIKQYIYKFEPKIKYQGDREKGVIMKNYKQILRNAQDYLYYHKTVPEGCQDDRFNITQKINSLNDSIDQLNKQKSEQKLRTQAKIRVNFESKCFRKHCWQYRQTYIYEKILGDKQLVKEQLDKEFVNVIELISRLSPPGTKIDQGEINKNSVLLDEILSYGDSSFEKIFIFLHFLVHEKQLALLQNIVVKQSYNKFFQEMEKFLQNVKYQNQDSMLMKNTLGILGINVVESVQNDEFKYLQGFCFINRDHNFATILREVFYHNISYTHMLCRTMDVVDVLVNYLTSKVKSQKNANIFRVFDLDQFSPVQTRVFKMRNQQFLKTQQKQCIKLIRGKQRFDKQRRYLTTVQICDLKQDLFDLKTFYFTYMIKLQEDHNMNIEIKAQKIIQILEKITQMTKFVTSLNKLIQFNKSSIKKINENISFIEQSQNKAYQIKQSIVPKIKKVMDKIQGIKQKDNNGQIQVQDKNPTEQTDQQQQFNQKIYQNGTMSLQTKEKNKNKNLPKNKRNNNNGKTNGSNKMKKAIYHTYYQDNQQQHTIIQSSYVQKAYYDMITGTWVADS